MEYLVEFKVSKPGEQLFLGFVFERSFCRLCIWDHLTYLVENAFQSFTNHDGRLGYPNNEGRFEDLTSRCGLMSLSQDNARYYYSIYTNTKREFCCYDSRGSWDLEKNLVMLSMCECECVCMHMYMHCDKEEGTLEVLPRVVIADLETDTDTPSLPLDSLRDGFNYWVKVEFLLYTARCWKFGLAWEGLPLALSSAVDAEVRFARAAHLLWGYLWYSEHWTHFSSAFWFLSLAGLIFPTWSHQSGVDEGMSLHLWQRLHIPQAKKIE